MSTKLLVQAGHTLLNSKPKKVVLSGPSGFLGSRVLDYLLEVHQFRIANNLPPGEVVLLSSSPGTLMKRLSKQYGIQKISTVRASRVDYYTQHKISVWRNHLGSLGLQGEDCAFVNLAAVAGPVAGKQDALMDVNYRAPAAAGMACSDLDFGHWIQSSTQATNAERSGQVPYARAKAMCDYALANMNTIPVTICLFSLLYSKRDGLVGQLGSDLNLADLSRLPLTPIMGSGLAPLQPHEVSDAAKRIAYLALTDPALRPLQESTKDSILPSQKSNSLRVYDAVGPETMTMMEMLKLLRFYQNPDKTFRPVHIDYRNMEKMLNVKSLGNMNRQFVSLLRSEQDTDKPLIGDYEVWEKLIGEDAKLGTLQDSFDQSRGGVPPSRKFPIRGLVRWMVKNPKVIPPGAAVVLETLIGAIQQYPPFGTKNKKDQKYK